MKSLLKLLASVLAMLSQLIILAFGIWGLVVLCLILWKALEVLKPLLR